MWIAINVIEVCSNVRANEILFKIVALFAYLYIDKTDEVYSKMNVLSIAIPEHLNAVLIVLHTFLLVYQKFVV